MNNALEGGFFVANRFFNVMLAARAPEILFYETLSQYKIQLENHYLPLINEILLEVLRERKLSFSALTEGIIQHRNSGRIRFFRFANTLKARATMELLEEWEKK